ncbi:MAG: MFS transporter [Chthoniobacterales bacterium]
MELHSAADRNVRWFIVFRVLFNARFYYPVMAILFLDLGLTLSQYALLNVAWAAAIVLLEVPSGALADLVGRKRLVVFAACLMVLEMAVFSFAPRSNLTLLFWLFMLNRVISGAAEASASGADEALVYDSLKAAGRDNEWPRVLERLARWQSGGFFFAMVVGAAVYDPGLVTRVLHFIGSPLVATKALTVRWPVYLTLATSLGTVLAALRLHEPPLTTGKHVTAGAAFGEVVAAGRWIWASPLALFVIAATICNDSFIRLFLTIGSQYYRLIQLPEASFGLIGSGFALLGYLAPPLAKRLIALGPPTRAFAVVSGLSFIALTGLTFVLPYTGLIFPLLLGLGMSVMNFLTSYYLNQAADPARRATILSFRGLATNLAYGSAGLMFAGLLRGLQSGSMALTPNEVFVAALSWLPWIFAGVTIGMFLRLAKRVKG